MKSINCIVRLAGLLLCIILLMAWGSYCGRIEMMARQLHATYPEATLQDVYKTCYQDFWGAEHMAPDSAEAAHYLHEELEQSAEEPIIMPVVEPCGFRHHYCRVSLSRVQRGELTESELLQAFLLAASDHPIWPIRSPWLWQVEWACISRISYRNVSEWQDEELIANLRAAATQSAAVRHSASFRETYHPHYRICKLSNPRNLE